MRVDRRITAAAVALLIGFVLFVWSAGSQKSETIDEGLFIIGGALQTRHLQPNVDLTHPPLLRWVAGIPAVVVAGAVVPEPLPVTPAGAIVLRTYLEDLQEVFNYAADAFWNEGHDHDRVLFWGRAGFALIGALLCWTVFVVVRGMAGPWIALGALLVAATIPEVLAHSQWAHSDVASALTLLLAAAALARLLAAPTVRTAAVFGGAMGVAICTKLTALVLWPWVLVLTALFPHGGWRGYAVRTAAAMLACYVVIVLAHLPDPRLLPHAFDATDLAMLRLGPFEPVLRYLPLPDAFLKGVLFTALLSKSGHWGYFAGEVGTEGWLAYFPAALVLKYPTGLLLVAAAGLVVLWRKPHAWSVRAAFTAVPVALFAAAMTQSVNIGARSILPVAPFLVIWGAVAVHAARTRIARITVAGLLATSVFSGISAYPDFLAWFNPLAGGTPAASRWFVDSNYDWGQDLPALARELKARGIGEVRLAYFGAGRPAHYGIVARDPREVAPGWYAISRSYLTGWWPRGDPYGWLRSIPPVTLVGGSIALIHVTEDDVARAGAP